MEINHTLIEKYNVPVPRYTSYPPANHFTPAEDPSEYQKIIDASNKWDPAHVALYVHIPFCKKICFYCGCNACTIKSGNEVTDYVNAIHREIALLAQHIDSVRKVTQLHFGGGTPNAIPSSMVTGIVRKLKDTFNFSDDAEIAIETNPAYLDLTYLDQLLLAGFNRFSFGIQDFNTDVLKLVNREIPAIPVNELIDHVRNQNPSAAVNLDFIYGLPGQTPESFSETIKKAASLSPDRLVTFSYAHVPWLKKHQQILEKHGLPGPNEKTEMFLAAYKLLNKRQYEPIGLDHFVKPEDELFKAQKAQQLHRNFQGYCTRKSSGQVYALGVTGISQLGRAYLQHTKDLKEYISEIEKDRIPIDKQMKISPDQFVIREVITQLMCNKEIKWKLLADLLDLSREELLSTIRYDKTALKHLASDGIIEFDGSGIKVTETGSLFIRNVAASLDPAYEKEINKYSKSI